MELAVHFFPLCVGIKVVCQEGQHISFFLLTGQTDLQFGVEHRKMSSQALLVVFVFLSSRSLIAQSELFCILLVNI